MEAQGRVRRGYFVRGLSGVQFATGTSVERLRRPPGTALRLVATSDPANPYGPILPVAADVPYRPTRVAGNWLVLAGGRPVLGIEGWGKRLVPLDVERVRRALPLLVDVAGRHPRRRIVVETWADQPVIGGVAEEWLAASGFARGPRGMALRAPVR
jgi:ATP-dependent Lhr-like helicase